MSILETNKNTILRRLAESIGETPPNIEPNDWAIYSDSGADMACKDYIEETIGYFNASFLANVTKLPEEVFVSIQEHHTSETTINESIMAIVRATCGLDRLVEQAIKTDGRGHFLSSWDGEEIELGEIDGKEYFAYRIN